MILYLIIGTDGREYGPINADQIRQWIRENRVERQTPVFAPNATDWTFVGLLPEFAMEFPGDVPVSATGSVPPQLQCAQPATIAPVYPARSDSMAKAGLVCGILAVTLCCCCAGLPFNFLGLIFSMVALVQIAENPQRYHGRGMAILGLVLSALGFLVFLVSLVSR